MTSVKELRAEASVLGVEGVSKMSKPDLEAAITAARMIELTPEIETMLNELGLDPEIPEDQARRIAASHVVADHEAAEVGTEV